MSPQTTSPKLLLRVWVRNRYLLIKKLPSQQKARKKFNKTKALAGLPHGNFLGFPLYHLSIASRYPRGFIKYSILSKTQQAGQLGKYRRQHFSLYYTPWEHFSRNFRKNLFILFLILVANFVTFLLISLSDNNDIPSTFTGTSRCPSHIKCFL